MSSWLENDTQKSTSITFSSSWGRTPEQLAKEYEPSARTIRNWMQAAERAMTAAESDKDQEIKKLKAENDRLREERDILKKAAAWFASESVSTHKRGTRS